MNKNEQNLAYLLIIILMRRQELRESYTEAAAQAPSSSKKTGTIRTKLEEAKSLSIVNYSLYDQYSHLLYQTYQYVVQMLQTVENPTPEQLGFAASVISISCLRILPHNLYKIIVNKMCVKIVTKQLNQKSKEMEDHQNRVKRIKAKKLNVLNQKFDDNINESMPALPVVDSLASPTQPPSSDKPSTTTDNTKENTTANDESTKKSQDDDKKGDETTQLLNNEEDSSKDPNFEDAEEDETSITKDKEATVDQVEKQEENENLGTKEKKDDQNENDKKEESGEVKESKEETKEVQEKETKEEQKEVEQKEKETKEEQEEAQQKETIKKQRDEKEEETKNKENEKKADTAQEKVEKPKEEKKNSTLTYVLPRSVKSIVKENISDHNPRMARRLNLPQIDLESHHLSQMTYLTESCSDWLPTSPLFFKNFLERFCEEMILHQYHPSSIPQYHNLIRCLVSLMLMQPDKWLDMAEILVKSNPEIINVLMDVEFNRTNVYNVGQAWMVFSRLEGWIKFVSKVPSNFRIDLIKKALSACLMADHFRLVSRTVLMIYNILDAFEDSLRVRLLSNTLFIDHFNDLFLHWNDEVRQCFMRLIVYKVIYKPFVNNNTFEISLKSKAETYLHVIRLHQKAIADGQVPPHLSLTEKQKNYIASSLEKYQTLVTEYTQWKSKMERKRLLVPNQPIPYPLIKYDMILRGV
eukprot:CAMPEP_0117423640 /NCGR_PEP_ID=MMETSP0758-20121206/4211_1 /TAXON_ID=63605 /ORGANISM="Percolomonas cosmopolitus, Strain AE-1 (ATCC 50343)" /LENGTH=695 /DNA_ID=CAMNT_0005206925 /DNA_START=467 /DNA_END=2554 /DNA_ORIENTATION=+